MIGTFARGLAAGAVGTTALNAVSSLDRALRGRPAGSVPERFVDAVADRVGAELPGSREERDSRRAALGLLAGIANGLGTGVLASVARSAGLRFSPPVGAVLTGAASMAATDVPVAALGVSDPRSWSPADWTTDAVSHLAYGAGVQAVLESVPTARERAVPRGRARAGLLLRSALLGVASGCRSSMGFAGSVLGAPSGSSASRVGALAAVAGELTVDKRPQTPDRTSPVGVSSRLLSAIGGAARLATRERANAAVPSVAAAAGAAAGTWGGLAWRRWAASRMPDWRGAVMEDGVALALMALACFPGRHHVPPVAVSR